MIEVTSDVIDEMVAAIVQTARPEQVILFGSAAVGGMGVDSDVDILVVEREPFGPHRSRRKEISRIRRALSRFRVPKDILVCCADEVSKWRGSPNHVIGRCLRDGVKVYERS